MVSKPSEHGGIKCGTITKTRNRFVDKWKFGKYKSVKDTLNYISCLGFWVWHRDYFLSVVKFLCLKPPPQKKKTKETSNKRVFCKD